MDYRFWTDSKDLLKIRRRQSCAHRSRRTTGRKIRNPYQHRPSPGARVLHPRHHGRSAHGIHVTKEKSSVFTDPKMLDAFVYQWTYFAGRYKGVPSEKLSFNLVNEPIVTPSPAQMKEL